MSTPRSIGVIGAGNMGSGIAQKIATEGFEVILVDLDEEAARRGHQRIRTLLNEGVERRIFSESQASDIAQRVQPHGDLQALRDCDLVIEAVFEDLGVKRDLFARLDGICSPTTRLATNTSSFYVKDVAQVTQRPDRVVGLHYFFHPAKNRLVEVIPAEGTSRETASWAWTFCEATGKTPIASADSPGFVVNRYFVPWVNEAVRLLEENIADVFTIEAASKLALGIPMGPFELMNVTGPPITFHAATTLGRELGPFYAPCQRLAHQIEAGELWNLQGEADESRFSAVEDRLLGAVLQIANQMVDEGVCTVEDADIGARVGLRWRLGPFELANKWGMEKARFLVEAVVDRYDDLKIPALLEKTAASGKGYRFRRVTVTVEDGLAEILLNRPDALNALDEELMSQLAEAFDDVNNRNDVRTIVLRGSGKAFVAGADVKFFVRNIEANRIDRIVDFTKGGQELLARIDASPKHVICRLDGLSLGGGSELALCCDTILATEKGSLGFPETGIGIYPGLGGTQRLRRRAGVGWARYLILTGTSIDANTALAMGIVDEVVGADAIGSRIRELHAADERPRGRSHPNEFLGAVRSAFESANLEDLLSESFTSGDKKLTKLASRIAHKAPLACRLADTMILDGHEHGEDAGLALELEHLPEVFGSEDALEGLTALLAGRRPSFQGR